MAEVVNKPWGYEIWFAHTDQYAGKLIHVNAGERLSVQYHERKDETSIILQGSAIVTQNGERRRLGPGGTWRNEPGEVHTLAAMTDVDLVEVSTPELDDVVRLNDLYGRADSPVSRS